MAGSGATFHESANDVPRRLPGVQVAQPTPISFKNPSVNIKDDPEPAYQLRRYAWSAKLPLCILTDFKELAVYDCRSNPQIQMGGLG